MCCSSAKWKREVVPDHKFDFIDVREFHDGGCWTRLRYGWVYVLVLKSFLVYVSDLYTAIALLASNRWAGNLLEQSDSSAVRIPFDVGKWIFTGCIIFSFLLLLWEAKKARSIIRSRDISYSYTNVIANNYYCLKGYDYFCFFCQINNSRKKKDEFAFFVFFTFKGWKRLLLADAPRQVVNALTLYSFGKAYNFTTDWSQYVDGSVIQAGILVTMIFTVIMWAGSFILLLIAACMYVPLLCYIQGNLKEYCCHKVDKRIAELMKKRTRKRLLKEMELARKEAKGDFSHLKDRNGNLKEKPLAQPTLPQVDLDDTGYAGSISDSIRKEPYDNYAGSSIGGHMYPPTNYSSNWSHPPVPPQPGYAISDGPYLQPSHGYAASDVGSVHSMDKLMSYDTPHSQLDQPYVPPYAMGGGLSKAPSYRSQASLHDNRRMDATGAPPTPAVPDVYAALGAHMQQDPSTVHVRRDSDNMSMAESYRGGAPHDRQQAWHPQGFSDDGDMYQGMQLGAHYQEPMQHQQQGRPESEMLDFADYYGGGLDDAPQQPQRPPHR